MAKTKTKAELEQELNELKDELSEQTGDIRKLETSLKTSQYLHAGIVNDWNSMIAAIRSAFKIDAFSDGITDQDGNIVWTFRDTETGEILETNIKNAEIGSGFIQAIKKRIMVPDRAMLDELSKYVPGVDLTYLANQFIIPLWLSAFQSPQDKEQLQKIIASCYNRDGKA